MMALGKRVCELFRIEHPILLGGMAGATGAELVAAVSNAGGLGILGCARIPPNEIGAAVRAIRDRTDRPFGLNLLLFSADESLLLAVLECRAPVFSTAWPWPEQDLRGIFARAHDTGAKVVHMVASVSEAVRAAETGADAIAAQGTEGGGHVGLMGTMPLVPQVVRAVAPIPVIAAGGIATGEGLAAAL